MRIFISESARLTKSLRGATAYIAKSSIKVGDDDHESNIKKGEKFYLKTLGKKHYLMDVEGKEIYQFVIDEKTFKALDNKHEAFKDEGKAATQKKGKAKTHTDGATGMKEKRKQAKSSKGANTKKIKSLLDDGYNKNLGIGESDAKTAISDAFKGKTHAQRVKDINKSKLGLHEYDPEDFDLDESEYDKLVGKLKKKLIDVSKNMDSGDKLSDFGL